MSGMLVASLTFGGGYIPAMANYDISVEGLVAHASSSTLPVDQPVTYSESLLDQVLADPASEDLVGVAGEEAVPVAAEESVAPAPEIQEPATAENEAAVAEPEVAVSEKPAVTPPHTRVPITPGVPPVDDGGDRDPLLPRDVPDLETDRVAASAFQNAVAATSAPNPPLPQQCGVSVAIVLDMSGSLSNADVSNSKVAARGVVDALEGTPSEVGVYHFGTRGIRTISKTPVASAAGANTVRNAINNVGRPSSGTFTNWDEPLQMVRSEGANYDLVLFVTDGQPNRWGNGRSDGGANRALDEAVNSANALKGDGTAILGVGVGSGINVNNIIAISASNAYYTVSNYGQLTAFLTELAEEDCRGTVSVVKEVRDINGNLSLAGGWEFSASTPAPGEITPATATTAPTTGAVNFDISHPSADTAVVSITETQQAGYVLEQQGGFNAICRDNSTNATIPVTNVGENGWTLSVEPTQVVSCSVINQEVVLYEPLEVSKTASGSIDVLYEWDIDKTAAQDEYVVTGGETATIDYNVDVTQESRTVTDMSMGGTITVANPNDRPMVATLTDELDSGNQCTITGVADADPDAPGLQVSVPADGLVLEYECELATEPTTLSDQNTVTLTWDRAQYPQTQEQFLNPGSAGTGSVDQVVPFNYALTEVNKSITITDSLLGSSGDWTVTWDDDEGEGYVHDHSYSIARKPVAGTCVTYDNTATIVETGDEATESVVVCGGSDLSVDKNVVHSLTRTYLWEIDKSVDNERIMVDPDTGIATLNYTVVATPVTPDGWVDSGWLMSGEVTVTNPNEWLDITANVTDEVDIGGGSVCIVEGGQDALIPAGETVTFTYTCTFTSQPEYDGANTATVTWADDLPTPTTSATGTAAITDANWDETPVNDTITVMDDKTDPANPVELGTATWNADGTPTEFTYSHELEGTPGQCVDFTNMAWIAQTQQSATADVTVCDRMPLTVDKTVTATYDRTYEWLITKDVDETEVSVDSATGAADFAYEVNAIPDGYTDSGWAMSGQITVTNPNDFESVTVTVTDVSDVGGDSTCTVIDAEDVVIEPSGSVTLDYDCVFDSEPDYEGVNTATVTSDNGTFTATADITFALDGETDRTVDVIDDKTDPANPVTLGEAEWNADGVPTEFEYTLIKIGVPGQCFDYTNTAWLELTGGEAEASVTTELCVSTELDVEKTVTATYDRAYHWDLDKSVDQTAVTVDEETGSADFSYLVRAIPNGYTDSGWDMFGEIAVTNPNPYHPVTVTVADLTDIPGTTCTVVDGVNAEIGPDSTETFTYSCDVAFEDEPRYDGTNVASVLANGEFFTDRVPFDFTIDVETDRVVDVMDDQTDPDNPISLGTAEWNADSVAIEFPYTLTHEGVPGQCVTFTNTAWIDGLDGVEDSTDVELCVESPLTMDLADNVRAQFDREYLWTIDKQVDVGSVLLDYGENALLHYTVAVTPDGYLDTGHELTGSFTLTNPNTHVSPIVTIDASVTFDGVTCEIIADDIDETMDGIQIQVPGHTGTEPGTVTLDYACQGEPDTYTGAATATATYLDANGTEQVTSAT